MDKLDYQVEMNDGMGEIFLDFCTLHFDPDNSAEHYLKRGISRQAFFEFAAQVGEMMLQSIEKKLVVDLDLKHIRMENDIPYFSVCMGESTLTHEKAAIYLKELAYKANFAGSDFLMYLYDYLTFIDANKDKTLNVIIGKIYSLAMGVTRENTYEPIETMETIPTRFTKNENKVEAESKTQDTCESRPTEYLTQNHRQEQQYTTAINYEPAQNNMQNDETGVLDPNFWNRYGNASSLDQNDNPHRIKRNEPSAVLQSLSNGQKYSLNKECVVFGKDNTSADYALDNDTISRAHAEIVRRDNEYYITDLGSTNGTFVNSKKVPKNTSIIINNGDIVKLSNEELRFMIIN